MDIGCYDTVDGNGCLDPGMTAIATYDYTSLDTRIYRTKLDQVGSRLTCLWFRMISLATLSNSKDTLLSNVPARAAHIHLELSTRDNPLLQRNVPVAEVPSGEFKACLR